MQQQGREMGKGQGEGGLVTFLLCHRPLFNLAARLLGDNFVLRLRFDFNLIL